MVPVDFVSMVPNQVHNVDEWNHTATEAFAFERPVGGNVYHFLFVIEPVSPVTPERHGYDLRLHM